MRPTQTGYHHMYCPKCGKKNNDENNYCEYCGNPLRKNSEQHTSSMQIHTENTTYRRQSSASSPTPGASPSPGNKILLNVSRGLVGISLLVTLLFALSVSSYSFHTRNLTDDNYWEPGEHWVSVTASSAFIPSSILQGTASDVVDESEVAAAIEVLKPRAAERYTRKAKEGVMGSAVAVAVTFLFFLYVKRLCRK